MIRVSPLRVSLLFLAAAASAQGQHEHMHHPSNATLQVNNDPVAHVLTVRVGPVRLPANADHMQIAQPPALYFRIPVDGWITAYHPRLVDEAGKPEPGRLLHHVAFHNASRPDFLCPNKLEHTFGAGGELNDWPAVPGFGYRVHRGDRMRVTAMFHNPTEDAYLATFLEVRMEYQPTGSGSGLKSVYPAWFDVGSCGNSEYDLPAGPSTRKGKVTLGYSGILLGVGGHMHDYGRRLTLENTTRGEQVARLDSKLDATGHIVSMPIVLFLTRGGYRLQKGDTLETTADYDNPTGHALKNGAMGIVVGYFLPGDDTQLQALHR
jgi:hypothetical protein